MSILSSTRRPSRRQFIVAASAFGAASVLPLSAAAKKSELVKWKGSALGAEASIQLYHPDPKWAYQQLVHCQREIDRLENLFSLYRENSSVCTLNKDGFFKNPDIDFVDLLSRAKAYSLLSGGVFDVTVQPLWSLYADHFSAPGANSFGPAKEVVQATLEKIDSAQIHITPSQVSFLKAGMGITLNGIAQGYITDKIIGLLKSAGFDSVLISLGEQFALGEKPDFKKWRAGIVSPTDGTTIIRSVDLENAAIATSGGYGSPFAQNSNLNHLLDPRTGRSADVHASVTVIAKNAVKADMASTALSLMTREEGRNFAAMDQEILEVIYL